jgi:hypothetical protein
MSLPISNYLPTQGVVQCWVHPCQDYGVVLDQIAACYYLDFPKMVTNYLTEYNSRYPSVHLGGLRAERCFLHASGVAHPWSTKVQF